MCESQIGTPVADEEPAAARPTIGQIFRDYGPAYRAQHAECMSPEQLRVMSLLERCRTGGLGRVTFNYRKSGSRRWRSMTVTADEFIRRFLQHVLPSGFQKVRYYGFAHPRKGIDLEWLKMLVTTTLALVYVLLAAAKPLPVPATPACPQCGQPMTYLGFVPAASSSVIIHDSS